MTANFLQIHTLTGYSAALLNRDDIGRAKRLRFGGCDRIRVSSQCLKRHWREQTGEWSLAELGSRNAVRSRRIFSDIIAPCLRKREFSNERILGVLEPLADAILKGTDALKKGRAAGSGAPKASGKVTDPFAALHTDQVIVLGEPEIAFLTDLAAKLARDNPEDPKEAVKSYFKDRKSKDNLKALVRDAGWKAGLDAALFGRMVTSDLMARRDAAVHVAHSFTVHAEEAEPDYFSALDDLNTEEGELRKNRIVAAAGALDDLNTEEGELGSGHINTTELTSGLFYAYAVIDLRQLTKNLSNDRDLAASALGRLVHLIATVSPGAKLGATAPYACAELVLAEAGERQPRTLANAFMDPVTPKDAKALGGYKAKAAAALDGYLERFDAMYGEHEDRKIATMIEPVPAHGGERVTLNELASWAAAQVGGAA